MNFNMWLTAMLDCKQLNLDDQCSQDWLICLILSHQDSSLLMMRQMRLIGETCLCRQFMWSRDPEELRDACSTSEAIQDRIDLWAIWLEDLRCMAINAALPRYYAGSSNIWVIELLKSQYRHLKGGLIQRVIHGGVCLSDQQVIRCSVGT